MNSGANGEGQSAELRSAHLDLQIDDEAADQAEGDLRDDEPQPVDAGIEDRADDAERGVEHAGPEKWSDEAGGEDGLSGEHRQHGSVEQADEDRGEGVNAGGREKPRVKLARGRRRLPAQLTKPPAARRFTAYQML